MEFEQTKVDENNLYVLSQMVTKAYSVRLNIPVQSISPVIKNNLLSLSQMFYYYMVKDIDQEGRKHLPYDLFVKISRFTLINHFRQVDTRYQNISTVIHTTDSYLMNILETSLVFLMTVSKPLSKTNPLETLMPDLFVKFFSQGYAILKMLNLNLPSEGYSIWRTLHEAECVIKLLNEGGQELRNVYLKHLVYNNAFRHSIPDKEESDKIFVELKSEMKAHGLKSKDMKKFIEYGWLYACKDYHEEDNSYKLNFRDGLQKTAGLSKYNIWYETASELAHSSPIFFYANDAFFMDLTTLVLGSSLVRVVKQFEKYCEENNIDLDSQYEDKEPILAILYKQVEDFEKRFDEKYEDYLGDDDNE